MFVVRLQIHNGFGDEDYYNVDSSRELMCMGGSRAKTILQTLGAYGYRLVGFDWRVKKDHIDMTVVVSDMEDVKRISDGIRTPLYQEHIIANDRECMYMIHNHCSWEFNEYDRRD